MLNFVLIIITQEFFASRYIISNFDAFWSIGNEGLALAQRHFGSAGP